MLFRSVEILLHIGLDTVDMNGDGFQPFVKAGDRVKRGDRLIAFDEKKIRAAGHPCTTILVVTEEGGQTVRFQTGGAVRAGRDQIMTIGGQDA